MYIGTHLHMHERKVLFNLTFRWLYVLFKRAVLCSNIIFKQVWKRLGMNVGLYLHLHV